MTPYVTTTIVSLALLSACSLDRSAPPIPTAQPAPPSKVDPENAGNQIPTTKAPPSEDTPIEKVVVPGDSVPEKPVVPPAIPDPAPPLPETCDESKMITLSKALTPSFAFNGFPQSLKYELTLTCNGTAMPIKQQILTFDLDASMTADNATYDVLDAMGKVIATGSIIYIDDTDLNGPKPGFYIWSTKALALATPQTKITFVLKTGVFNYGAFLGTSLQTYQRIGTSQFAKISIPVSR